MKKIIGIIIVILAVIAIVTFGKKSENAETPAPRNDLQDTISYTENADLVDGEYVVSTEESIINWEGKTLVKRHYGTIDVVSGNINVDTEDISGVLMIDPSTISSEIGDSLDSHLKSEDFFDVVTYPEITLAINSYINNELQGDLTIKGVTQPVSLPTSILQQENQLDIVGSVLIDRTLWGVEYNSGTVFADLGDNAINDSIELDVLIRSYKK